MNDQKLSATGTEQLVYAIGTIGYAFESESQEDAMKQYMKDRDPTLDMNRPADLVKHLQENPFEIEGIIWTLKIDGTTIYALQPDSAHAHLTNARILALFVRQINDESHLASIPGTLTGGQVRLRSGQTVPIVDPGRAPINSWTVNSLVETVLGQPPKGKTEQAKYMQQREGISNFLQRVYYEIRNLGQSPQERAMNFAATTAYKLGDIFADSVRSGLELDRIEVEKSPIQRLDSDSWDVKLTFFNPAKRLEQARKVHRFIVDVSTVAPVQIGVVRSWSVY